MKSNYKQLFSVFTISENIFELSRLIIGVGIGVRFWVNQSFYDELSLFLIYLLISIMLFYSILVGYLSITKPYLRQRDRWITFQVMADIVFASVFFRLTFDAQSDFFLLYFYPLLLISSYIRNFPYTKTSLTLVVVCVLFAINVSIIESGLSPTEEITRIILPRITFFFLIIGITAVRSVKLRHRETEMRIQSDLLQEKSKQLGLTTIELNELKNLTLEIYRHFDNPELLTIIVREVQSYLNATSVHIRLAEDDQLRLVTGTGEYWKDMEPVILLADDQLPEFARFFQNNKDYIVQDARNDRYFNDFRLSADSTKTREHLESIRSFGCFPLSLSGQKQALITITFDRMGALTQETLDRIHDLSPTIAIAIRNSSLLRQERELKEFYAFTSRLLRSSLAETFPDDQSFETMVQSNRHDQLKELAVSAKTLLRSSGASVFMMSSNHKYLYLEANVAEDADSISRQLISINDGVSGHVASTREYVLENRVDKNKYSNFEYGITVDSMLSVPMLVEQNLLGVISVYSAPAKHRRYSLEDVNRLTGLAKQATLAIYSDRLQMRDRYLLAASERLTSKLEIDSVATTILDLLKEAIPYDSASVQDLRSDYFTIIECDGFEERNTILGRTYSINESTPNKEVYETKQCVVFDDIREKYPEVVDPNDSQDIRSWLGIPLLLSQKIVGMVVLDRRGEIRPFTKEEIETANLFLRYASIALNNAKAYRVSRMLYQLASALGKADELEDAGNALLQGISNIIEYNSATLQLIAEDGIKRRIVAASNVHEPSSYLVRPISDDPLVTEIVSSKQTMVISYTEDTEETRWEERVETAHVKSWIGVPLVYGNKVIGLLTLDHQKPGYYKDSDKSLIELIAAQAAVTVENVRLLDKLDFQLRRLHDAQSLAMIGLIYGEDLHLTSNKLGAARQFAKNIRNGLVPHDEIKKFADYIATSISEVLDLIAAIEDTVQAPDSEDISISELISEVISAMRLSQSIHIEIGKLPENDIVHGFKQQIGQVIRVVIFNAKEAMDNQGKIRINFEEIQKRNGNFLQVAIRDNGRGIPAHIQPKVFEIGNPRKRKQRRGFGFGLAWSRLFLHWYGGDMNFETEVNKGTTMYIDLPRVFRRDA